MLTYISLVHKTKLSTNIYKHQQKKPLYIYIYNEETHYHYCT